MKGRGVDEDRGGKNKLVAPKLQARPVNPLTQGGVSGKHDTSSLISMTHLLHQPCPTKHTAKTQNKSLSTSILLISKLKLLFILRNKTKNLPMRQDSLTPGFANGVRKCTLSSKE